MSIIIYGIKFMYIVEYKFMMYSFRVINVVIYFYKIGQT